MEHVAWDGEWYLRAFFDDGTPLGSHANPEAKHRFPAPVLGRDFGRAATPRGRATRWNRRSATWSREKDSLVLLFTPPFDHSEPNPGYIMGYPPGLRENGGQYTHGLSGWLWHGRACAKAPNAVRLLQMMNPVELTRNPEDAARYKGEPYVVAADVYSRRDASGRPAGPGTRVRPAGCTASGSKKCWGCRVRGDRFTIDPAIPDDWPGFEMTWRYRSATYEIAVKRDPSVDSVSIEADGTALPSGFVPLVDDGCVHKVSVRLPEKAEPARNVPVTVAEDRENVGAR